MLQRMVHPQEAALELHYPAVGRLTHAVKISLIRQRDWFENAAVVGRRSGLTAWAAVPPLIPAHACDAQVIWCLFLFAFFTGAVLLANSAW